MLLVSRPSLAKQTVSTPVGTTQVAPTLLTALGLDPMTLEAYAVACASLCRRTEARRHD